MSSNNIYNILGKLKGITDTAAIAPETTEETVYESVEPRGSLAEAVKQIEAKYQTFKEAKAKPDFLDVDKDGDKAEPFKKAVKDKKAVKEAAGKPDFLDLDKDGDKKEPMKKAAKDKNNAKGAFKDMFGGSAKDLTSKLKIKEGAGPYTLDDPKHPKFKANYEKFKKSNPDCKLADFVAAMKKKEKSLSEAAYDEPAPVDTDAVAKRKRLQAIKDRQEDERAMGGKDETNTPIRKVAGKAYGGAAQADEPNEFEKGNFIQRKKSINLGPNDDLDEVAPPGAKAERMVKHIKKGYADDGKLTKKEKGIAYATAWKAHNKGQVEESTQFGDKIDNSKAEMKKAKPMKLKEGRVMEETDYFYEQVAKSLCGKNPNLDTAGSDFVDAVRKEMVAQGIQPNRARNILLMDEDFLSDVASSYGHYCKEVAESGAPTNSFLGGAEELDEIARLAGLPTPAREQAMGLERASSQVDEAQGVDINGKEVNVGSIEVEGVDPSDRPDFADAYITYAEFMDGTPLSDVELVRLEQQHGDLVNQAAHGSLEGSGDFLDEDDVAEGNEFSGALAAAKAKGEKEFEVDGKRYTVKEDVNLNLTASGDQDVINLIARLAGIPGMEVNTPSGEPSLQNQPQELPMDAQSAIEQGVVEPVEEERDIEYVNTPNEKIGPVDAAIPSGDDLNRSKKQYRKEYPGDNPMAVAEAKEDSLWSKYSGMLKGLIK